MAAVKEQLYILDTNVLIEDPEVIFRFQEARVGIPITVLEELDKIKIENSSRGASARLIARHLDKIRSSGSLKDGVKLENGTVVQILFEEGCSIGGIEQKPKLRIDIADNKILMVAVAMQTCGYDVIFVTKDINARIKADALGIKSQDYLRGLVLAENYYKGWQEFDIPSIELRKELPSVLKDLAETNSVQCNEFIALYSKGNEYNRRIFRYRGGGSFREIIQPKVAWPISAKNMQQLMALDLLLDSDISMVSLTGPAGTGKTFLTLFVGLYSVLVTSEYYKMTIARSVVPLGHDIGFLPGDVQEKLRGWMQPMYDNVDMITRILATQTGAFFDVEEEAYEDHNHHQRHSRRNGDNHGRHSKHRRRSAKKSFLHREHQQQRSYNPIISLDDLINQRKVSLEAISYMRGRSIARQFIFIDEAQNLTPHEIKTLLSRVAAGSKIILSGDPYQIDVPYLDFSTNGLVVATDRFKGQPIFGSVFLPTSERSEVSRLVQELL
ncbi:MAG TPA: PhoH family protein [Candidatus Saccharimonadales bacterium]|nr:PhoH family protein [Candidatus Saccharimonadales bacterium]